MAQYVKHKSNYIRTNIHQHLKGGSTIFERDWVTVGSQLNFGPGKIPYYNNGNFIFTTSPIPYYQKRYKNGTSSVTWTYENVKDAQPTVNQIQFDEYTEDICSYAYYGSCVELVRSTIENIINTFPGNIMVSDRELGVYKTVEEFVCNGENSEEKYVPLGCTVNNGECKQQYWTLDNPFEIDICTEGVDITRYTNPMRYLSETWKNYQISVNGCTFSDITNYTIVTRKMYEKVAEPCEETVKEFRRQAIFRNRDIKSYFFPEEGEEAKEYIDVSINNLPLAKLYVQVDVQTGTNKETIKLNNWDSLCYDRGDEPNAHIRTEINAIRLYKNGRIEYVASDNSTYLLTRYVNVNENTSFIDVKFYIEVKKKHTYKYYQMFDDTQYENTFKNQGWVKSTCLMDYWLPDTVFLNRCDDYQKNVLYSELSGLGKNQPVYTVTILGDNIPGGSLLIEGYIYNGKVIPLVHNKYKGLVIQPKEEIIEEYFNGLKGLEKQLLTRKTKPLYTSRFITPIEYNLGYLYYKRTYTWPHMYYCKNSSTTPAKESYCIDITSPNYVEFLNKLSAMAESFDELWTDNMWRRMTHEAIKNYDWTYTREYVDGDEEENVEGGERMHKVINVIGRVFDDVKLRIDTIKKANTITYNGDRNMPNALISDKLELKGWDIYSTIWPLQLTEEGKNIPTSEYFIKEDFFTEDIEWYPTLRTEKMTFADVDNDFMRKLLLSTNRIMMSKGTVNSIDMVMGLFGYGRMDEDKPDYEIHEEYYSTIPINYEMTFKDIAEATNPDGSDKYICYQNRTQEERQRDENDKEVIGDKIVRLNSSKDSRLLYYDDVSGIPVGSFVTNDNTYLIPFYDQSRMYDGNFYFQGKGGWGYNAEKDETIDILYDKKENGEEENVDEEKKPNPYKWTETISYLHVVSQVKDLLNVVPNDVHEGDIFYVSNISDLIDYTETLESASHFFVLNDEFNPEKFDSWKNVNMSDVNNEDEDTKKAKYLDSIIPYNLGNNPHVGYGFYDMGKEYFDYMRQPFKYSVDNDGFETIEDMQDAERIRFCIKKETDENKVKIFGDELAKQVPQQLLKDPITMNDGNYYWGKKDGLQCKEYKLDKIKSFSAEKYYLNSKIIRIKNNLNGKHYKNYFKNVIIKYLMQVIPSTAILVLEDF